MKEKEKRKEEEMKNITALRDSPVTSAVTRHKPQGASMWFLIG